MPKFIKMITKRLEYPDGTVRYLTDARSGPELVVGSGRGETHRLSGAMIEGRRGPRQRAVPCYRPVQGYLFPAISQRLDEFNKLKDGWLDGYGQAFTFQAITWYRNVLYTLFTRTDVAKLGEPGIFPTEDGGVSVEWPHLTAPGGHRWCYTADLTFRRKLHGSQDSWESKAVELHASDLGDGHSGYEAEDFNGNDSYGEQEPYFTGYRIYEFINDLLERATQ